MCKKPAKLLNLKMALSFERGTAERPPMRVREVSCARIGQSCGMAPQSRLDARCLGALGGAFLVLSLQVCQNATLSLLAPLKRVHWPRLDVASTDAKVLAGGCEVVEGSNHILRCGGRNLVHDVQEFWIVLARRFESSESSKRSERIVCTGVANAMGTSVQKSGCLAVLANVAGETSKFRDQARGQRF